MTKTEQTKTTATATKPARKISKKAALANLHAARARQRSERRNSPALWAWAGKTW